MRPQSNMGYLSGKDPIEGMAHGTGGLLPQAGDFLLGARELGPWVDEPKPKVRPQSGATRLPT